MLGRYSGFLDSPRAFFSFTQFYENKSADTEKLMYYWLPWVRIITQSLYTTDHKNWIPCDDRDHVTRKYLLTVMYSQRQPLNNNLDF
jgi:hypothetical protein